MTLDGDFTPEEFEKARRLEELGENPHYGPGNPDWELDFDREIGTCQSCGCYHDMTVRTCSCGGYVG